MTCECQERIPFVYLIEKASRHCNIGLMFVHEPQLTDRKKSQALKTNSSINSFRSGVVCHWFENRFLRNKYEHADNN